MLHAYRTPTAPHDLKVLIVEDNQVIALEICDAIERSFRCEVRTVTGRGIEALEAIANDQPHVVVSDLSVLRKDDLKPQDLVSTGHALLIITADAEGADEVLEADIACLQKPFCSEQLLRRLEDVLRSSAPGQMAASEGTA